ncbi:MAG: hypothetical protein ABIH99_00630 [Candidatus Micrarchaeota archaeon]
MAEKTRAFLALAVLLFLIFSFTFGCTTNVDVSKKNETSSAKDAENNTLASTCPSASEVDEINREFWETRTEMIALIAPPENASWDLPANTTRNDMDVIGSDGRTKYDVVRARYMEMGALECKNSSGGSIPYAVDLKCGDITKGFVPEQFLELDFSRRHVSYYGYDYWSKSEWRIKYAEYIYGKGSTEGGSSPLLGRMEVTFTGSEFPLTDFAKKNNFTKLELPREELLASVYYSEDYKNDYGNRYKGIWLEGYGDVIFIGYWLPPYALEEPKEAFNEVEMNYELAREVYYEACFTKKEG